MTRDVVRAPSKVGSSAARNQLSPGATGPALVGRRAVVSVPATCANLGPGFDCLALALRLRNTFEVTVDPRAGAEHAGARIEVVGQREDICHLPLGGDNLVVQAFRTLCEHVGARMPALTVRINVRLPPGRGLGSSATAVVAGALAANALLGEPLSRDEVLQQAVACEPGHHADNVAAALMGGLVVTGAHDRDGCLVSLALPVPTALRAVLFVPDVPMSTTHSRSLLPAAYSRGDATFNVSRVALLLAGLQLGRLDVLATAMEDRLHQPYREQLMPALQPLIVAGLEAGALGACLSGGGSSILALVTQRAEDVCAAMETAARGLALAGRGIVVEIAREGAECRLEDEDCGYVADRQGASDD
jgi:homoserine kinase